MSKPTAVKPIRILVVDDQAENRYLLRSMLGGLGHHVEEAADGREALEKLRTAQWDLVISDILMPVMDGYQLCRNLHADERLRHIPFIFYTATYVDARDEEFALKLGADRFLRKPMDPKAFLAQIQGLMAEVAANHGRPPRTVQADEREILVLYNERLIRKLEKKMLDLEREAADRKRAEGELKRSEEKYRTLVEQASDAIIILSADTRILDVNPAACSILGRKESELVGMAFTELIPQEDLDAVPLQIQDILRGRTVLFERKVRRLDGTVVPLEISAKVLKDGRVQCIARDVSERQRAQDALRESEERYALAARGSNDGLWDWNLKTDTIYFSPRWKAMLGCEEGDECRTADDWFGRVHPDDADRLKALLRSHMDGVTPHFEAEHQIRHKDGTYRWVLTRGLVVRDPRLSPSRIAGSMTDITERKRAEEQLLHDAFHDALTGLPNRALFTDRLSQAHARAKRSGEYAFAVLHADLDRLQVINESLGHATGDAVLKAAAERIRACLRPGDTLARFGGDEFLVLLDGVGDFAQAGRIIEAIKAELARPLRLGDHETLVTASMGIVMAKAAYERPEDYLRDAHLAMHKAKARGRASVEAFDANLHAAAMERLKLESALRRAVEDRQFQVYYQPVVDLQTARLTGLEALVRWDHPERGVLLPHDFLKVAEEAAYLVAIDRLVMGAACSQLRRWIDKDPSLDGISVSVNFCSRQFSEPDLTDFIGRTLEVSGLRPRNLCIEITEGALMENIQRTQEVLTRLRSMGVGLYIDDFGTGYSSLSYLHHFPIDLLKIDRSFVAQMTSAGDPVPIVQTIITMAHTMGMKVLAEGVETGLQCARLKSLECNYAQGFLFSRPVGAVEAEAYLMAKRAWL